MILYVLDAALIGGAGFLFLRGIYHGGAIARMAFDGLRPPPRRTFAEHLAEPLPAEAFDHDAHELALFRDTGAWWLDPNRWGEEARKHEALDKVLAALDAMPTTPRCPSCVSGEPMIVAAQHGKHVSLWSCAHCLREWVPVGRTGFTESKLSRRRREKKERIAVSKAAHEARALEERRLPCGCTGEVWTRAYPTGGWDMGRYAECVTCKGTWDYAAKGRDTGNPRKKVRGEVEWPNGNPTLPEQLQRPPGGQR